MRIKPLLLALALASTAPGLAHAEDLMQVYAQARQNDPQLALAGANLRGTQEGVVQARSALLPQVNASLGLTQSNETTTIGGINSSHVRDRRLSVNLTQSLLNLSSIADLKAADKQSESQGAQYRSATQDLLIRVATAYFNVLTAKDQVHLSEANEKSLARELDQAEQRFKVGLSPITDVQDAKAQHDSAVAQLISAKNALDDTREALEQITGQPVHDLKTLREGLPLHTPVPDNIGEWVNTALKNNPNIMAQQYNVDAAEDQIDSARAGHLPTLSANISYGKGAEWSQLGYTRIPSGTTIGLTLNVPIFSGGLTQSRVRQSIAQRDAAQDGLTSQRRQTIRNTRSYFRSVIAGISEVEATRQAVESSKSALQATEAGFKVGTRTIVDVLLAQQTLINAQQNYSQARHQFVINQLLLKQSAGVITVKDLQSVNALLQ